MSNHTIHPDADLLRCSACPWRGVITNDGRLIQTQAGERGHDHIGQALRIRDRDRMERIEYAVKTAQRLGARWESDPHGLGRPEIEQLWRHIYAEYWP